MRSLGANTTSSADITARTWKPGSTASVPAGYPHHLAGPIQDFEWEELPISKVRVGGTIECVVPPVPEWLRSDVEKANVRAAGAGVRSACQVYDWKAKEVPMNVVAITYTRADGSIGVVKVSLSGILNGITMGIELMHTHNKHAARRLCRCCGATCIHEHGLAGSLRRLYLGTMH